MPNAHRIHTTMGLKEWGLLLVLAPLWGPACYFTEIAITALPPLTVVAPRRGVAALALHLPLRFTRQALPLGGRLWPRRAGVGFGKKQAYCDRMVAGSRIGRKRSPTGESSENHTREFAQPKEQPDRPRGVLGRQLFFTALDQNS